MRALGAARRGRRSPAALITTLALLAGAALAAGAPTARAATPDFPSWLVGYGTYNPAKGTERLCSAVELNRVRELTGPDCFTGRTSADWAQGYHGGTPDSSTTNPTYRVAPQYDTATRTGAFAVARADNPPVSYTTGSGHPDLATTADAKLYAAGAGATFYSWAGQGDPDGRRVAHKEQVSILSPATCGAYLGHPQAAGTFCTLPKSGTAAPDPAQQCVGDAGGALLAGGKLIGLSATGATGCVAASGVRVYVNVTAYRGQMLAWSRDVFVPQYVNGGNGSVVTQLPEPYPNTAYVSWQFIDPSGRLTGTDSDYPGGDTEYFDVHYDWLTQAGDLDGDAYGDLLARTPGGALYRYPGTHGYDLDTAAKTWLGNGFDRYTSLFASVDFSGDGFPDLLARDTSGNLWLFKGDGRGGLAPRVAIGSGWNAYDLLTGRGDLSGDGVADIVARDPAGTLWLLRGNGKGGYAVRTKIGTGFNGYRDLVAAGDMDNDGRQDILGRTPGGGVFLLNANGKGGLAAGTLYTKTGWKQYSRIS
ncbi:FG-GAP-like repeat-containing protein [Actinacidiphila sp. ITFR-21]|uniref:FG-GAP-like repeat-containing protein n=1 Tax=Actinacidiphila sp. ITFR-21 TaxID=3075199 RepID=UPI00288BC002|nr:FG-GAP-like repeat-containing protein [Streptomyces sp. ITFR-21]WNI16263.1 FG-GAP-like repeat-containing protein [Streptomyces sp. ITFR-21]